MGDGSGDTLKSSFYDASVLDHAPKRLLEFVTQRKSAIVVTGNTGTGKSFLIHRVIKTLPSTEQPILLAYPRLSFRDVVDIVLKSLNIDNETSAVDATQPRSLDFLRWCLRKESLQGRRVTLFVDEAHDLSADLLRDLLQLAQQPRQGTPFIGLVLVGLPTLEEKLAATGLRETLDSEPFYFRLRPLNTQEMADFVRHYFLAMGMQGARLVSADAVSRIWNYSRGTLSLGNRLCSALLIVARKKGIGEIDVTTVDEAAALCSTLLGLPNGTFASGGSRNLQVNQPRIAVSSDVVADQPRVADSSNELQKDSAPGSSDEQAPVREPEDPGREFVALPTPRETPMDRTESLNKILKSLQQGSPDVEASALITEDGLMIASSLPQDLDEITVGGMSATLLNLGTRAATELKRGDVQEVIVRGEQGYGVMVSAGRGVLLLVVANERAKLGLIFFDMRSAINAIKRVL